MHTLFFSLLWLGSLATAQSINVVVGESYDSVNSGVRTYGLWYSSAHPINDSTLPIAVFIHGGTWSGGTAYGLADFAPSSCSFANANTVLCGLAAAGYAVYSINYTLVTSEPTTKWPAQWQDCDCFLKFLAEQAGVTVPGNPNRIYLFGHSAGAHLAGLVALAPHSAFATNCSHASTKYTIKAAALFSPPLDLRTLWNGKAIQGGIAGLLGCTPSSFSTSACVRSAATANPDTYAGHGQVPILVESGLGDAIVPYQYQGSLQSVYAGLNPAVNIPWKTLPSNFNHDLDLFYFNPCTADPEAPEPSPCGNAGTAYKNLVTFFAAHP
jgi:acetyl esterase/lipase